MKSTVHSAPDSNYQTVSNQGESRSYAIDGTSVELMELHDEPAAHGVIPSLLSVYQQRGYQRGYQRAVNDIMGSLFSVTEEFVKASAAGGQRSEAAANLRRVLYQFGQQLERRLQSLAPDTGFVSDGLGI